MNDCFYNLRRGLRFVLRLIILLVILALLVYVVPMAIQYHELDLSLKTYNAINFHENDTATYQGHTYYKVDLFYGYVTSEMELISWHTVGYRFLLYSAKGEQPVSFRNEQGVVYLREDIDYKAATYRIQGTEQTIPYQRVITDMPPLSLDHAQYLTRIDLLTKIDDTYRLSLKIYQHEGAYYMKFESQFNAPAYAHTYYPISDEFVQMLKDQGIIEAP